MANAENLFVGPIAEEYQILKKLCPPAADISRRVGEFVGALPAPASLARLEILEIGTGTGITTLNLLGQRPDSHILSIDVSEPMLAQARRNLAPAIADGQVQLQQGDALSFLATRETGALDVVASGYTLHNFLDGYRTRVLAEIHRVLKPGGVFVNGDRYALDDLEAHLRGIQAELRGWFRVCLEMQRLDLLEEWVVHLQSDESPEHIMRFGPALAALEAAGFAPVNVHYREGVNTLLSATKPWS
jgi:SAM-dependent methyltransferase